MTIDLTRWCVRDVNYVARVSGRGFRSLFYERCGGRKGAKLWDGYRLRPWYKLVPICIIFCLVGLPVMCIKLIAVAKRV